MFRILVAGYLMLLSCNNARLTAPKPQNKVSNSRSEMTSKNPLLDSLNIFLKEKKFNPGAAGWEGYTGAHDPTIKTALTTIVNGAITDFIKLVQEKKATKENCYKAASAQWQKVVDIQHTLDTDEGEVAFMYFDKLCRLVGLPFDEELMHAYGK